MNEGHKKLQIYQHAHQLAIEIHRMTLLLPSFERYEEGSRLRCCSKSIPSNIVEGYAMGKYKVECIHALFRSYASCKETMEHLELLKETGSFNDLEYYDRLHTKCDSLCGKLLRYIQALDEKFEMPACLNEPEPIYEGNYDV